MRFIGEALFVVGLASILFHFLDREVSFLAWISNWGEGVAWAIRVGLVVVGLGIWLGLGKCKRA